MFSYTSVTPQTAVLFMKNRCLGGFFFHLHGLVSPPRDVCRAVASGWGAGLLLGTLVCKRDGAAAHHSEEPP